MARHRLVDHELVVHVFAPIDGPRSEWAHRQICAMWTACRTKLGLSSPIAGIGLPPEPPDGWRYGVESRPLAARERPGADCQAILRREQDTLNLSVVFAPVGDVGRRLRVGSASEPGWVEFDRWWDEIAAAGTDDLLGLARVYQAKCDPAPDGWSSASAAAAILAELPPVELDDGWWQRELTAGDVHLWELAAGRDTRRERRLVAVAPADRDPQLGAFTWSRGDTALPPLGRYLMHAARLRYRYRAWAGGQRQVTVVRHRIAERVDRLHECLYVTASGGPPGDEDGVPEQAARLRADLAAAALLLARLRDMLASVADAADGMARAVDGQLGTSDGTGPVAEDRSFAVWFTEQLTDAITRLSISHEAAGQLADAVGQCADGAGQCADGAGPAAVPRPVDPLGDARAARPRPPGPHTTRLGFAIDVVGYGSRSRRDQAEIQRRIAGLVIDLLRDLRLGLADTDHRGSGDGLTVFLPPEIELDRALPHLLCGAAELLAVDNKRHADRIRLRVGTSLGPTGLAALGLAAGTTVECARLADSRPLRDALARHPDADLAVLISEPLRPVGAAGNPRLNGAAFARVEVCEPGVCGSEYRRTAWLWLPAPG